MAVNARFRGLGLTTALRALLSRWGRPAVVPIGPRPASKHGSKAGARKKPVVRWPDGVGMDDAIKYQIRRANPAGRSSTLKKTAKTYAIVGSAPTVDEKVAAGHIHPRRFRHGA